VQSQEEIDGILDQNALPSNIESRSRGASLMAELLGLVVRLVDRIRFRGATDKLFAHHSVVLEADIDISSRFIDNDSALQRPITPFLFPHGYHSTNFLRTKRAHGGGRSRPGLL